MNKFLGLAVAGFATLAASQASALTVSSTATFGPTLTDFTTSPLTIAAFDPTLGTLTGISLSLSALGNFSGNVTNNAPSAQNFRVTEEVDLSLTSANPGLAALTAVLTAAQTYTQLASHATAAFGPSAPTNNSAASNPTDFADFEGGPLSFVASTLTGTSTLGGGGNIGNNITTQASGTVTVTYTYTAAPVPPAPPTTVPEPASMALLGMGLAGVGLIRRRRA